MKNANRGLDVWSETSALAAIVTRAGAAADPLFGFRCLASLFIVPF